MKAIAQRKQVVNVSQKKNEILMIVGLALFIGTILYNIFAHGLPM